MQPAASWPFHAGVAAPRWQPVVGLQPPQELKEPPLVATTVDAAVYVKVYVPPNVTDPFVCVFTVAAVWQFALAHPDALCFGCACVLMVAVVIPWHSVQVSVPPPSTVFHVYGESAAELCPLLWHWLIPQVPNVPPLTATALAAAGV